VRRKTEKERVPRGKLKHKQNKQGATLTRATTKEKEHGKAGNNDRCERRREEKERGREGHQTEQKENDRMHVFSYLCIGIRECVLETRAIPRRRHENNNKRSKAVSWLYVFLLFLSFLFYFSIRVYFVLSISRLTRFGRRYKKDCRAFRSPQPTICIPGTEINILTHSPHIEQTRSPQSFLFFYFCI